MQNFVVSARKYRPSTFETVVGQAHITTTLKNAIRTNHLAQAFLFCGPRGVGKTTCARILAKTINCENLQADGEACGTCPSCQSYQNNNSFNIHELDAASNNSVDDIRNLNEQVRIPPQYGNYKVYIIDEVHMLSQAAFNAFLKTLEEPPRYAIFILATTEKHKILPTILSRCQIFDFNRIKISDISNQLIKVAQSEGIEYEDEGLRIIAQKADGGMRDALSMFDMISTFSADKKISYAQVITNLHILDSDYYFRITDYILDGNVGSLLVVFDEILQKGFDGHHFILGLADHFRNVLVASDPATHSLLEIGDDKKPLFLQQASRTSNGVFLNLLSLASTVDLHYKNSKNQRLLVELCLLKMANVPATIASIEAEKKKHSLTESEKQSFKTAQPSLVVKDQGKLDRSHFKATINIKESVKVISSQPDATEFINFSAETINEIQNLSVDGLAKAKEQYIQWLKTEIKAPVSHWSLAIEEHFENTTCYLTFSNDLLIEDFQKEKAHIHRFFSLHYDRIPQFETRISDQPVAEIKPYTNSEKFNFLGKKHPKILLLKARLGLEAN
ncbi:MAG TPA: DNA polymerase III subunit gamma/tau [Catalimonadaceae bacterium]|nr:DNA polymerase III subunit gamma/tau [Catalimonadaceae bacterium]